MRLGVVLHQEEPRAHCSTIRSDSQSEDFILVPNSSQGTVGYEMEVCATLQDMSLQTITDPLTNRSCWMMLQAA